jgi:hypothetical protein
VLELLGDEAKSAPGSAESNPGDAPLYPRLTCMVSLWQFGRDLWGICGYPNG